MLDPAMQLTVNVDYYQSIIKLKVRIRVLTELWTRYDGLD